MFRIPVIKIKNFPGSGENFSLSQPLKPLDWGFEGFRLQGPVLLTGSVENVEGGLLRVQGRFQGEALLSCDRCNQNFTLPVAGDFRAQYGLKPRIDQEGEEDIHPYSGDFLDITPQVLQEISLLLPMKLLCREDCQGLCCQCGLNLNQGQCSCTKDEIDPRLEILKEFVVQDSEKGV